jgi:hypothetical protein
MGNAQRPRLGDAQMVGDCVDDGGGFENGMALLMPSKTREK